MGWFGVNALVPVFLPALLLLLVTSTPVGRNFKLMETVKDGQLCWFAPTLSCSSFYDLMDVTNLCWGKYVLRVGPAMACTAIIGGVAALYAVAASVQTTPLLAPAAAGGRITFKAWLSHYTVFITSAALSATAALVCLGFHEGLPTHRP